MTATATATEDESAREAAEARWAMDWLNRLDARRRAEAADREAELLIQEATAEAAAEAPTQMAPFAAIDAYVGPR